MQSGICSDAKLCFKVSRGHVAMGLVCVLERMYLPVYRMLQLQSTVFRSHLHGTQLREWWMPDTRTANPIDRIPRRQEATA